MVFPVSLPDFRGYDMESQVYSSISRLVVLWFSKIDRKAESWKQIQVTLVNAQLSMANVEIVQSLPPLRSCEATEIETEKGKKISFKVRFDAGELSFECEDIACTEFSRKISVARSAE